MQAPEALTHLQHQNYRHLFEQEKERLNERQAMAVEAIDGPVMVIAGPGTGKTQILAIRIGNIMQQTDAQPENILCLTYTDAGAIAMRQRLLKFIGPEAYKVEISTFHAFCNKVIKDNLDAFGIRALDSITELEQVVLFRNMIDGFGNKHPLKRWTGEVYYDASRLKRHFELMKKEDLTPDFIRKKIDEYLQSLPERENYLYKRPNAAKGIKIGDVKQAELDRETKKMNETLAATLEYPTYQKMMAEKKRYDFDDMILLVLKKFREDPDLLLTYQERFQYFLVDEYQDTNGAQNEILKLLVSYWDSPNVFVVGDDDQSIYRFQGANVENILTFNETYPDNQSIVLEDNYRSSQAILNTAMQLISGNENRLVNKLKGLQKNLKAKSLEVAGSDIKPQVRAYYNTVHETVAIATEIEALHKIGKNLNEVAVIYRSHKQAEDMVRYLEAKGVPINIKRKTDILQSPFINGLISLLRYIDGEARQTFSREDLLFEILHFNFFRIDPLVIARMAIDLRNKTSESQKNTTWREEIKKVGNKIENSLFGDTTANDSYKKIKLLSDNIEYWIEQLHNTTLQLVVEKIITRGGILKYILDSPLKFTLMQELNTFFDFLKEESVKDPKISLTYFLKQIDLMVENKLSLPYNQIVFSSPGVHFLTAHSSKGLEFEHVYLIGCTRDVWDKQPNSTGFKFPDNIFTLLKDEDENDQIEESRRLFYVALTRAKEHLVISYPMANENGKELEPSRFVEEVKASPDVEVSAIHLEDEEIMDYTLLLLKEQQPPLVKLVEENHLKKLLENYSLSVTHLSTYLKCPVSFYYSHLLKVPQAKNEYMAFGSAVHVALEKLFRNVGSNGFPPAPTLVADFEWYMHRHQDSFTKEQFTRRLEYGREILPVYYAKYVGQWNKIVTVERNFRNVVNGVPINGKIDKLEFDGNDVNLVDYKTGKYDNAKTKFDPPTNEFKKEDAPTHEEKHGGDYWRQAVFYKILVENEQGKDWNVISTEYDFVEPDRNTKEFIKRKVSIGVRDMAIVVDQISEVYKDIMAQKFDKGCNEKDCKWCNFARNQYNLSPAMEGLDAELES